MWRLFAEHFVSKVGSFAFQSRLENSRLDQCIDFILCCQMLSSIFMRSWIQFILLKVHDWSALFWFLGKRKNLNLKKAGKISLVTVQMSIEFMMVECNINFKIASRTDATCGREIFNARFPHSFDGKTPTKSSMQKTEYFSTDFFFFRFVFTVCLSVVLFFECFKLHCPCR